MTLTERCSSVISRSEQQYYAGDQRRLVLRKHIHELESYSPEEEEVEVVFTKVVFHAIEEQLKRFAPGFSFNAARPIAFSLVPHARLSLSAQQEVLRSLGKLCDQKGWRQGTVKVEKVAVEDVIMRALSNYGVTQHDQRIWVSNIIDMLTSPMRCMQVQDVERLGKYLGYLDLRMDSMAAPVEMGLLVVPRHLRHNPNVHCVTGVYGPLFGGPSFASSVFSMHDPFRSGARCAQACVIMAQALLSDRGMRVRGSYEITYLAKRQANGKDVEFSRDTMGLTPEEIVATLNVSDSALPEIEKDTDNRTRRAFLFNDMVNFGPDLLGYNDPNNDAVRQFLIERLIEAYILARYPIISLVGWNAWNSEHELADAHPLHAVIIAGFSYITQPRAGQSSLLGDAIVHDPSFRPFIKCPLRHLFKASADFDADKSSRRFIFVTDDTVSIHAAEIIHSLYYNTCNNPDLRLVDYLPSGNGLRHRDLRIGLIHRDDIINRYFADHSVSRGVLAREKKKLREGLRKDYYWCFAGYEKSHVKVLWVYDAKGSRDPQKLFWAARVVSENGDLQAFCPPEKMVVPTIQKPIANTSIQGRMPGANLVSSVISSSSDRPLRAFLQEVAIVDGVPAVDLYVPHYADDRLRMPLQTEVCYIDGFTKSCLEAPCRRDSGDCAAVVYSPEEVMRRESSSHGLYQYIIESFGKCNELLQQMGLGSNSLPKVAALATYFPNLLGNSGETEESIEAIVNTVRLAVHLDRNGKDVQFLNGPIVEIVCGSLFDQFRDKKGKKQVIGIHEKEKGLTLLQKGLDQVVERTKDVLNKDGFPDARWAIALELEPGTYILRDKKTLTKIAEFLLDCDCFNNHVGLNVDIAHYVTAKIAPEALLVDVVAGPKRCKLCDLVVHGHICDLPGMHTRDQPPGSWYAVDDIEGSYYRYLRILENIAAERGPHGTDSSGLPFSGAVALELEGCSRISWVHHGLSSLSQMLKTLPNI